MKLEAEYKKLPEVAQIIDSLHATPEYQEDGLPIVRPTDILKGNLSLEGCKKVAPETFAAYTQKYVPARGDIVLSRFGKADSSGTYTSVIFSYVNSDAPFCLGQNTAILVPKIDGLYLYYCLLGEAVQQQLRQRLTGSIQKTIGLKGLSQIEIPVYPPEVAERIYARLEALHEKITLNEQLNTKLAELAELTAAHPGCAF